MYYKYTITTIFMKYIFATILGAFGTSLLF
ncbi:hypothetical protein BSF42_33370 [Flavobacterium sp. ACN6]|nr:hypothetical protein BSF42_33370 [Flavobacterium sp. ACN6]